MCSTCGRQFGHLSHLRRHEEVHRRLEQEARRRPEDRRTYQPRRIAPRLPPPPAADIVRRSLESARIPLKVEGAAPAGTLLLAPVAAMATVAPVVAVADAPGAAQAGPPPVVLPAGAEPNDILTTVVGPECKEIIIVECEV